MAMAFQRLPVAAYTGAATMTPCAPAALSALPDRREANRGFWLGKSLPELLTWNPAAWKCASSMVWWFKHAAMM